MSVVRRLSLSVSFIARNDPGSPRNSVQNLDPATQQKAKKIAEPLKKNHSVESNEIGREHLTRKIFEDSEVLNYTKLAITEPEGDGLNNLVNHLQNEYALNQESVDAIKEKVLDLSLINKISENPELSEIITDLAKDKPSKKETAPILENLVDNQSLTNEEMNRLEGLLIKDHESLRKQIIEGNISNKLDNNPDLADIIFSLKDATEDKREQTLNYFENKGDFTPDETNNIRNNLIPNTENYKEEEKEKHSVLKTLELGTNIGLEYGSDLRKILEQNGMTPLSIGMNVTGSILSVFSDIVFDVLKDIAGVETSETQEKISKDSAKSNKNNFSIKQPRISNNDMAESPEQVESVNNDQHISQDFSR